jgi:hypothetical protein
MKALLVCTHMRKTTGPSSAPPQATNNKLVITRTNINFFIFFSFDFMVGKKKYQKYSE